MVAMYSNDGNRCKMHHPISTKATHELLQDKSGGMCINIYNNMY